MVQMKKRFWQIKQKLQKFLQTFLTILVNCVIRLFKNFRALRVHEGKVHKVNRGSPIPQLDGENENFTELNFVSEFATDDIELTLRELFPDYVETHIISQVKIGGLRSAEHLCTVSIKFSSDQTFSWPDMVKDQAEVFKDLRMLLA